MNQSIAEHLDMVARSDDTPASENGGWQVIEWLLWTPSQCQCLLVHVPMSKVIREMKHLIGHICNYVIIQTQVLKTLARDPIKENKSFSWEDRKIE